MTAMGSSKPWAYLLFKPVGDAPLLKLDRSEIIYARHRIGRNPICETVLEGYTIVSSEHCTIYTNFEYIPGSSSSFYTLKAWLIDSSTNGTIVNGTLLQRGDSCELHNGSTIEMKGKKVPLVLEFHLYQLQEKDIAGLKVLAPSSSPFTTPQLPKANKRTETGVTTPQSAESTSLNGIKSFDSKFESEELLLQRRRVKELELELDRRVKEYSELDGMRSREKEKYLTSLAELREKNDKLNEQNNSTLSAKDAMEKRVKELEKENQTNASTLQDLQGRQQELIEENVKNLKRSFQEEKDVLLHESKRISEDCKGLSIQLETERNGHSKTLLDLMRKEELLEKIKLESELKESVLKGELEQLKQKLLQEKEMNTSIKENLERLRLSSNGKISELEQSIKNISDTRDKQKLELEEKEKNIVSLSSKLLELENEVRNANTKHQNLECVLQMLSKERDELKSSLESAIENEQRVKTDSMLVITRLQEELAMSQNMLKKQAQEIEENTEIFSRQCQVHKDEYERLRLQMQKERADWATTIARKDDGVRSIEHIVHSILLPKLNSMKTNATVNVSGVPPKRTLTHLFSETEREDGDEDHPSLHSTESESEESPLKRTKHDEPLLQSSITEDKVDVTNRENDQNVTLEETRETSQGTRSPVQLLSDTQTPLATAQVEITQLTRVPTISTNPNSSNNQNLDTGSETEKRVPTQQSHQRIESFFSDMD